VFANNCFQRTDNCILEDYIYGSLNKLFLLSFIDTNKDLTVATDTISAIKSQSNKNHNANKKIIILKKVQKNVHNIFKYVMYKA